MKTIIIVALVLGFFSFIATGLYRLYIKYLEQHQNKDASAPKDVLPAEKDSH